MHYRRSKNSLPFSVVIIIATLILINVPNYVDGQSLTCEAQTFRCANRATVPYPFWGGDRPKYCGHPKFELNCTGSVPQITIESITYRVIDIVKDTRNLTVARADYWDNLCPKNPEDTVLDDTLYEFASGTQNLTLSYGCLKITATTIQTEFPCPDDAAGKSNYFATEALRRQFSELSNLQDCGDNVVVRVSGSAADNLVSLTPPDLSVVLESGFGIVWKANDDLCERCLNSEGICGSDNTSGEFACYCKQGTSSSTCTSNSSPPPAGSTGSSSTRNWIIGIAAGVTTGIVILSIIFICFYRRQRKLSKAITFSRRDKIAELDVETFLRNYGSLSPNRYSYVDVKKITNSFAEKIGTGGYGAVYKGKLSNGCLVAVKMLKECKGNGEEFMNEVASIGRTSHVNVVTLLGFCYERKKRALVYEYMPNGSLDKFIFNQESSIIDSHLEWKTLFDIAVGVARGLEYLHRGCNTTILHFDIKPHNILLDKDLCPKISDFGLAKLWLKKEVTVSMVGARGTVGNMAPEVFSRAYGRVSNKSDVYSYGMLVLEMVGGRKNFDCGVSHTSEIYYPTRIYKDLEMGNKLSILTHATEEENEFSMKMSLVSFWCIQTNPSDRPSMSKVVDMLEGSLQSIEVPPKPFLFSPTRSLNQSPTPSL